MLNDLFIPLATGVFSYFVINWVFAPILRFREIRRQIHSDLINYANAFLTQKNYDLPQGKRKEWIRKSKTAHRKQSADLTSSAELLPFFYNWWVVRRGLNLEDAAKNLLVLSNQHKSLEAIDVEKEIRRSLGLPPKK